MVTTIATVLRSAYSASSAVANRGYWKLPSGDSTYLQASAGAAGSVANRVGPSTIVALLL